MLTASKADTNLRPISNENQRIHDMAKQSSKQTHDQVGKTRIDKAVPKPIGQRAPRSDSYAAQLRELEVGDTWSRSVRIPGHEAVSLRVISTKEDLSNTMPGIIRNAKSRLPNAEFSTAVGEFRARDGDVLVTIAVTRTA